MITKYSQVVGNIDAKSFLQNLARTDGGKFILLTGPAGHGKSTLAKITTAYELCENPDTILKEPCGQCPSCLGVFGGDRSYNYLSINVGRFNDMSTIDSLKEELQNLTVDKIVVVLEELQELEQKPQAAMMDVLDKALPNAKIIATTYKPSDVLKAIRDRAFELRIGLNSFEIKLLTSQLLEHYGYTEHKQEIADYLVSKHLSPRKIEGLISNFALANKKEIMHFYNYFNELPNDTIVRLIIGFTNDFRHFANYVSGFDNETLHNIVSKAYSSLTAVIHKIEYDSGRKGKDYDANLFSLLGSFSGYELYRLMFYLRKAVLSKDITQDIYSIKYEYERSKMIDTQREQYGVLNKAMYMYTAPEKNKKDQASSDIKKEATNKIATQTNLMQFGSKSFTLE